MSIAIDRGWLTPPVRVAGGILVALGLVGGGLAIHEQRRLFAQTLEGAGLAVAFLTFFGLPFASLGPHRGIL